MRIAVLAYGVLLAHLPLPAQSTVTDNNLNGWIVYNGDHSVSKRWGVHLEGQFRRHDFLNNWQQLLLRPAVNYQIHRNVLLSSGYVYVRTHRYGDYPLAVRFPEHRLYQQAIIRGKTGRIDWQQRPRLEQRWLGVAPGPSPQVDDWRYQNRFRYLSRAAIALRKHNPGGLYAVLQDEIFLNFGNHGGPRTFDQNRLLLGLGRQIRKSHRVEWGYMNQYLAQRNGRVFENNHIIHFAFISSKPFRK